MSGCSGDFCKPPDKPAGLSEERLGCVDTLNKQSGWYHLIYFIRCISYLTSKVKMLIFGLLLTQVKHFEYDEHTTGNIRFD